MPRACSMSAVVRPPMPPPTIMTFIAQLINQRATSRIMIRKIPPAQRFSPDVVDGGGQLPMYLELLRKSTQPPTPSVARQRVGPFVQRLRELSRVLRKSRLITQIERAAFERRTASGRFRLTPVETALD